MRFSPSSARDLVGFGECRVVENRVTEVLDRATVIDHCLADVHQLGRFFAEDLHRQQAKVLGGGKAV